MKTKPLTLILALTFLFLFSGSVYGEEEVKKEYWDNGKFWSKGPLKSETPYNGLGTGWYETGQKEYEVTYKNGKQDGIERLWGYLYSTDYQYSLNAEPIYRMKYETHYKNGKENRIRKEWDNDGNLTFEGNFVNGSEEIK